MSNITITNVNNNNVILKNACFRDELLKFTGIATILMGTILARQAVAAAVVAAADGGNTGDGTVTAATVVGNDVQAGAYVLTCTAAVTHGGVFDLVDPQGRTVATGLAMTAGAGVATDISAAGLQFTVTDGATDFIVGDIFTLTVAADGDLVPYAADGVGGAGVPLAILTYEVTSTGAGDIAIRAGVSGEYRKELLVIDGSAAGVGITNAIIDQLRDFGLVAIDVDELGIQDNQ